MPEEKPSNEEKPATEESSSVAEKPEEPTDSLESSLETKETVVEKSASDNVIDATQETVTQYKEPKKTFPQLLRSLIEKVNVYLLLFIVVLTIAGFAAFISWKSSKNAEKQAGVLGQELSAEDLAKIKTTDSTVGDSKQTLTIASNAIFNGRVLVRDSLDVAGTIRVGGALSLPGITVSGTSTFENVSVSSNLSIAGNTAVQGTLTVQKNITVAGGASFGGPISAPIINTDRLVLNSDLQINRHIDAGGPTPGSSRGPAVGGAGTVSVSGTDTSGSVNVNFGPGSTGGIIANITFRNPFAQTPHVVITPVGSSCADLNYYVTRSTGGFSIGSTNPGAPGASCAFDYIAID